MALNVLGKSLVSLQILDLGDNIALRGSIGTTLKNLTRLKKLRLSYIPQLRGTIPEGTELPSSLEYISLQGQLQGTLPSSLASLTNLTEFYISEAPSPRSGAISRV